MPIEILKRRKFQEIRNLKSALKKDGISIIAEIKKMSPSAGVIKEFFEPIKLAKVYEKNGASAISILTDKRFFGGRNEFIIAVKKEVMLPVLRKDFIIDEYQIYESRWIGADAILLIARILTSDEMNRLINLAQDLGMTSLIEIYTENELEKVLSTPAKIIGINNRNLDTLEVNIENSLRLRRAIPSEYITVSESGIKSREDVLRIENAGFDAMLIGETLMKSENPDDKLKELLGRKA
jgi:indole-3-glycerol phosphate synthase